MRKKLLGFGLVASLLWVSAATADVPTGWKVYTPPDARFQVALPGQPEVKSQEIAVLGDKVKTTIYLARDPAIKVVYLVAHCESEQWLAVTKAEDREQLVNAVQGGMVAEFKGKISATKKLEIQGLPAREIRAHNNDTGIHIRARLVMVKNRVYVVTVIAGTAEDCETKNADAFLGSLDVERKETLLADGWRRYQPKDGGFRVALPADPQVDFRKDDGPDGAKGRFATARFLDEKSVYMVIDIAVPKKEAGDRGQMLNLLRDEVLSGMKGSKVRKEKKITIDGQAALEVTADCDDLKMVCVMRLLALPDQAIVLAAMVPKDREGSPSVRRFFDSFELTTVVLDPNYRSPRDRR
jgi:hypothetical protein